MLAEGTSGALLDEIAKIWPVITSVSAAAAYLIGTKVRAHVSDHEQQTITKTVENLEKVIEQLVEQKTRNQEHISQLVTRLAEVCNDIKDLRGDINRNASSIERIRGRMSRGENRGE